MRFSIAALSLFAALVATSASADDLSDLLGSYSDSHAATRAAQPSWSSPLVTTTGLLEQRLRFDMSQQHAGNEVPATSPCWTIPALWT